MAREELGEDPLSMEKDIEAVRQWLVRQPGLNARTGRMARDDEAKQARKKESKKHRERYVDLTSLFLNLPPSLPCLVYEENGRIALKY